MNKLLNKYSTIGFKYVNAFTLAAVLILPGLFWAALDKSLWWGDPCGYALHSVSVYSDLTNNLLQWRGSLFNFYKSPMIFWIGEFFVPLGKLFGSVSFSLLLIPLIASYITLVLLFRSFESFFKSKAIAICGSLLVAASPLFNGLSTGFWIEPMQIAIISWFIYALSRANVWGFYFSLSQFIIAVSLAMLIKASSPLYIIGPAVAFWVIVLRSRPSIQMDKRSVLYLFIAFLVFLPAAIFFYHNFRDILGFASYASTSPLFFGTGSSKVELWMSIVGFGVFQGFSYSFAIILLVLAIIKIVAQGTYSRFGIVFIVAVFQVGIFFMAWIKSPNDDSRYFLPILPYFAFLVCWSIAAIGNRIVTAISVILFLFQLGMINGFAFGLVQSPSANGMIHPLVREASVDMHIIHDLMPLAQRDSAIIFDLHPSFGPVEFQYELAKQDLSSHWAGCCRDIGMFFNTYHQQIDTGKINIDTVWKQVLTYKPQFYITWRSRLSPDSAAAEIKKIDKYNGITVPARWAVAERMQKCLLYEPFSIPAYPDLLIYKRDDVPLTDFPKTHLVRVPNP